MRRETSKFLFVCSILLGGINLVSYPFCYSSGDNNGYLLGWIVGSIGTVFGGWLAARTEFIARWCYEKKREDILQEIRFSIRTKTNEKTQRGSEIEMPQVISHLEKEEAKGKIP